MRPRLSRWSCATRPLRTAVAPAIAIAIALVCAGCHTGTPEPHFPPGAMVLHLAATDDVPTLDPAAGYDTASWSFEQAIFDTLVRYSDDGVKIVPDLATSWEISPDSKTFTFHLRHNARFSNGRAATSADLKYAIERVLSPATRSQGIEYYSSIVGAKDFIARRAKSVAGIETPAPYTLIFRLTAPDPIFLDKLAMPFAAAVPREVVRRWGDDFSRHAVGSGPFMLKQWVSGQRIVLVRNPYYFIKGLPRLDAVVESTGVNEELQWLKFRAGEIDVSSIPPAEFPYVMKTPSLKAMTLKIVALETFYLGMNCQMRPFNQVEVRRAFNYAINKRKLIAILNGRGVVSHGVLPPGMPGYNPGLAGYPYDPAKARQMLAAAGVPKNFSPLLWMRADAVEMMLGQSIQQDLALVGVNIVLKPIAWGPLLEAVRQPKTAEMFLFGWQADFPDPQDFLDVLLSRKQWGSNNDSFFYDPQVDALLRQAAPMSALARRYALYRKAEELVVADAPWVFLYNPVTYMIRQPWVRHYVLNPMRPARLEKVWLSPHRKKE